jgi:hypothetical protein
MPTRNHTQKEIHPTAQKCQRPPETDSRNDSLSDRPPDAVWYVTFGCHKGIATIVIHNRKEKVKKKICVQYWIQKEKRTHAHTQTYLFRQVKSTTKKIRKKELPIRSKH